MNSKKTLFRSVLLILLFFPALTFSKEIIKGGFVNQKPEGTKGPSDKKGNPVIPKVIEGFTKPIVTNDWWSSLIWQHDPQNPYSQNLFAHPLMLKAEAEGLKIGYNPEMQVSEPHKEQKGHTTQRFYSRDTFDFQVSIADLKASKAVVKDYSDWTVTALWQQDATQLEATFGHGLPFVYFTKLGGNAQLNKFSEKPLIWFNQDGVIGITIKDHHYGIFGPKGSHWAFDGVKIESPLTKKNYFSIAILPDNNSQTLLYFKKHAFAFVTDTSVSWRYDQQTAQLITDYKITTELKETDQQMINKPLIALFRHQWLHTSNQLTNYAYMGPRGQMKLFDGSSFTTSQKFSGILPTLPLMPNSALSLDQLKGYLENIIKLDKKARWNNFPKDTYWHGKLLGKIAVLIPIADQLGNTQARNMLLAELKEQLELWLTGQGSQLFYYDRTWRALIGYPASYGSDTELNDHHFHYGYFIMAAATIALYDSQWANDWGGMVEMLIKDASNWDRTDTRFGFLRHFDQYAGHSWANGPSLFGSGNNQESSSESINYSTGVFLWGAITGQPILRDLGIYLYTTEAEAIKQYWFDVDKQTFPINFKRPTVGMVWGDGGNYNVWWGPSTAQEIHGINFIPIQPGSLHLARYPDYLKINQEFMNEIDNDGANADTWRDIHMPIKALYDPAAAIAEFDEHKEYKPEGGASKAFTYFWILQMNALGRFDAQTTANIPTFNVFSSKDSKTYCAYNPGSTPKTVTFSDGKTLAVPANSLMTNKTPAFTFDRVKQK